MVKIYQNGNKWIYEYDGEIIAVEYSRKMAVACGEARVKAGRLTQRAPDALRAAALFGRVTTAKRR